MCARPPPPRKHFSRPQIGPSSAILNTFLVRFLAVFRGSQIIHPRRLQSGSLNMQSLRFFPSIFISTQLFMRFASSPTAARAAPPLHGTKRIPSLFANRRITWRGRAFDTHAPRSFFPCSLLKPGAHSTDLNPFSKK